MRWEGKVEDNEWRSIGEFLRVRSWKKELDEDLFFGESKA